MLYTSLTFLPKFPNYSAFSLPQKSTKQVFSHMAVNLDYGPNNVSLFILTIIIIAWLIFSRLAHIADPEKVSLFITTTIILTW